MLERGGNAFDAAVATGFTLQVVEPHLNGPGGEVPAIFYAVDRGEPLTLCGQGVAPAAATIERYRELGHDLIPGTGLLAACVPGAFGAWLLLLEEFGTWRLEDVLAFAIDYAEHGFPVVGGMRLSIERQAALLAGWPASRDLYLPVPELGSQFRNPVLAATYHRIVEESRGGSRDEEIERARQSFYEGFVAEELDRFSASEGGLLTGDDLSAWRATLEPVVSHDYHGVTVCKTGPWGAGPVALQQLALLEGFDVAGLSEAEFVHVVIECAKLAFADRDALYGDDPDVPLDTLLSRDYNDTRRALVGDEASAAYEPGLGRLPRLVQVEQMAGAGEPTRGDTVHLDVVDRWGNMISATPSGGWLYGSPVVPALGWPLGTRAQMFWLEEGLPSSLRPGARPRTTLSPGLALRDGKAVAGLGDARRRPAGAVGIPRVPPPPRPRAEPAGGDRCTRVPHRPPDLVVLSTRLHDEGGRGRGEVLAGGDRRPESARPRAPGRGRLVARPRDGRVEGERTAARRGEPSGHAGLRGRTLNCPHSRSVISPAP